MAWVEALVRLAQVAVRHCCRISPLFSLSITDINAQIGGCNSRLTEECIRQRYRINSPHRRIIHEIRIDEEEYRHIHRLAGIQPLLFKTKTLNLAEIG